MSIDFAAQVVVKADPNACIRLIPFLNVNDREDNALNTPDGLLAKNAMHFQSDITIHLDLRFIA